MKPVTQTILAADEGGNCFAACLASILELPIAAVPNAASEWAKGEDAEHTAAGWHVVNAFLYGLGLDAQQFAADDDWRPSGYWISSHVSPRCAPRTHATVWEGASFVWDPHPEAAGDGSDLGELRAIYALIVRDPVILAQRLRVPVEVAA